MVAIATVFLSLSFLLLADARFTKDGRCGVTYGCFSDCRSFDGCSYIIMWVQTSTGVDFIIKSELMSSSPTYIAFGLSSDKKMGEDSVSECVMNSGTFNVYNSYNPDDDSNEMTSNPALGLSSISGSYTNGILECSFKRANTTADPKIFSLLTDWYMFWAIGEYEESEKEEHDDWGISDGLVDLQSLQDIGEIKNKKIKAHGCLTIIAWIGFCSIGVVLARYYKPMWASKKIFGTAIWFQVHRAILIAAALLNLIAVIVIFHGKFEIYGSSVQKAHPVLGMIVTVISILNCVSGFLRPGPKHKFRPIFNWGHLALGLTSYILGAELIFLKNEIHRLNDIVHHNWKKISPLLRASDLITFVMYMSSFFRGTALLTIGIGVSIPDASVPFEVVYVIITFVVYQVIFELSLELIDRKEKRKTAAYNTDTQLNTVSGSKVKLDLDANPDMKPPEEIENAKDLQPKQETEPPCAGLKNILLGLHIGIILSFTLSIMVVVAVY